MRFSAKSSLLRVLLVVMLTTFLSPSFGWHMHAEHQEIVLAADSRDVRHDDGDDSHGTGGRSDAHASIGHLLGHLPMQMSALELLIPLTQNVAPSVEVPAPCLDSETSPLYRPPLLVRLT